MNCLSHACSYGTAIFRRASRSIARNSLNQCYSSPLWKTSFEQARVRTFDLEFMLTRFRVQYYSSKKSTSRKGSRSKKEKVEPESLMEQEKDTFFVVRKGDVVGLYKSLAECQAQVGTSVCDPPVSVYKGCKLPKDTEEYLVSCGLKNALYTIRAADVKEELFGTLVPCPFQDPASSKDQTSVKDTSRKRSQEMLDSEVGATLESAIDSDPFTKHVKLDYHVEAQVESCDHNSCVLEFDGASKGNPGQAGAAAVLRTDNGNLICKLREGLGVATNNVAEYRAAILGLKYALKKGYRRIRVQGDSKLVCMQVKGLWKAKNENMSELCEVAKQLKDQFYSFQIDHVLRKFNSEADAQANLAISLADGQIQEELG